MKSGGTWSKKIDIVSCNIIDHIHFWVRSLFPGTAEHSTFSYTYFAPTFLNFPFPNKAIYSHPISTFTSSVFANYRNTIIETSTKPPIPGRCRSHTAKAQRYHLNSYNQQHHSLPTLHNAKHNAPSLPCARNINQKPDTCHQLPSCRINNNSMRSIPILHPHHRTANPAASTTKSPSQRPKR